MRRSLIVVCVSFACISGAQAVECQASALSSDSHWAWRLIDGRKCWYQGASGMDKSLLHWPAADGGPDAFAAALDKPRAAGISAMPEVGPIPPEVLKMLPIMPPQPSFEDRWRLH
jgi:hypothetical protein